MAKVYQIVDNGEVVAELTEEEWNTLVLIPMNMLKEHRTFVKMVILTVAMQVIMDWKKIGNG